MAATDARPVPLKGVAYRVTFPIYDNTGNLVPSAAGLDSEISLDQAAFADCTNEATEISQGVYYLDLTAAEMAADTVSVVVKTSTTDAKPTLLVLYPEEAGDIRVNATQISGDGTAADNLEAAADGTGYNLGGGAVVAASVTGAVGSVTGNVGGNVAGSVASVAAGGITAASIATDAIDADAIKADAVAEIQSGLATAAALTTVEGKIDVIDDYLDTEVAAIKAKTDNLPASPAAVGSAMTLAADQAVNVTKVAGSAVAGVNDFKADVSGLATAAALTAVSGKIDTVDDFLDTEIAAIKAQTDKLTFTGTDLQVTLDGEAVAVSDKTGFSLVASDITSIRSGLALEATLTAMKGAGWTTETLAALMAELQAKLDASAYTAPDNAGIAAIEAVTDQMVFTTPGRIDASAVVDVDETAIATAVAAEVIAALPGVGSGARSVVCTVTDPTPSAIPGAVLTILDATGTTRLAGPISTEVDGTATFYLDDGSYRIRVRTSPTYEPLADVALTVNGDEAVAIELTPLVVSPSTDPDVCRVYGYLADLGGADEAGVTLTFALEPVTAGYSKTSAALVDATAVTATTDATGYFQVDLIPSASLSGRTGGRRYVVTCPDAGQNGADMRKVITVPAGPTANLATLI